MATAVLKADRETRRGHPARFIIALALVAGLAVATVGYLASALMIPGPAERAGTAELQARGAQVWVTFCSASAYEPRFWPECTDTVPEWRERGGERLIQFCIQGMPSRLFSAGDCVAADRPMVGLSRGPRPQDGVVGVFGAVLAAVTLGGRAWYRRRQSAE